jgi:uncharacterized protein
VPLKVYDETINVLKSAVQKAKLGRDEELGALQRLNEQARKLERHARGPSVEKLIAEECDLSHSYGGRSSLWMGTTSDKRSLRRATAAKSRVGVRAVGGAWPLSLAPRALAWVARACAGMPP